MDCEREMRLIESDFDKAVFREPPPYPPNYMRVFEQKSE